MLTRPAILASAICLGLVISLSPWIAGADSPHTKTRPLPSVRQVMDRYVRALGGRAAIFEHRSMTVRMRLRVPAKGLTLDHIVYFKDRRNREVVVLPDGNHNESGYDRSIAWTMTHTGGATIIHGDEMRSRARDADMRYPARILEYFRTMAVIETCTFEGHATYHLKGTTRWGAANEQFYDVATGLLVGYRWHGDAGEEREVFSGYRPFGSWRMPARIERKAVGGSIMEEVESVTFDDVADSNVALPPAVRLLLERGGRP